MPRIASILRGGPGAHEITFDRDLWSRTSCKIQPASPELFP